MYHHRVGITCRHIIAGGGDAHCSMIAVRWRQTLQHYFGDKGFDNITQVLLKSLKSKRNACRCPCPSPSLTYPGCIGNLEEKHFVPFEKHDNYYLSFLELKVYVNSLKPAEEQVVFEDEGFVKDPPQDDYDGEADNALLGVRHASTRMSSFRQMFTAECEMEIPMKPREVLTEPYRFICDYAELVHICNWQRPTLTL
jgi:hypothetical protein